MSDGHSVSRGFAFPLHFSGPGHNVTVESEVDAAFAIQVLRLACRPLSRRHHGEAGVYPMRGFRAAVTMWEGLA